MQSNKRVLPEDSDDRAVIPPAKKPALGNPVLIPRQLKRPDPKTVKPNMAKKTQSEITKNHSSLFSAAPIKEKSKSEESKSEEQDATPLQKNILNSLTSYNADSIRMVGKIAKFISQMPIDNDLHVFARSYGLVLIGYITEEAQRLIPEKKLDEIGKHHQIRTLPSIFQNAVKIRNALADFGARIVTMSDRLVELTENDTELAGLATLGTESDKSPSGLLNAWSTKAKIYDDASVQKTITKANRFSYMIEALQSIKRYNSHDPDLKSDATLFAVAMMYVIAGTCARELIGFLGGQDHLAVKNKELHDLLLLFKLMRNDDFAHKNIIGKDSKSFRDSIIKTNKAVDNLIAGLMAQRLYIEKELQQDCHDVSLSVTKAPCPVTKPVVCRLDDVTESKPVGSNPTVLAFA